MFLIFIKVYSFLLQTGTLTEEGLDVLGVLPSEKTMLDPNTIATDLSSLDPKSPLAQTMACCHTLTYIDSRLCGDPLDLSMFNALNWVSWFSIIFCFWKIASFYPLSMAFVNRSSLSQHLQSDCALSLKSLKWSMV